jgi:L-ascorbate metabolism protein UlaG (beta-lactamase superfamily)
VTWLGHATAVADLGTARVVFDPLLRSRARAAGKVDAVETHRARRRPHQPHDGLERGRATRAVAPQQTDDFSDPDRESDPVQDVALAVVGVQALDLKQRRHAASSPR